MNMYRSILKISTMLLLFGNSISFGMIMQKEYSPLYPMTVDQVLQLVEEDKKLKLDMTIVPKVSQPLKNSDKEYIRHLFGSIEESRVFDSTQQHLFKNVMIAIAREDYNDLSQFLLDLKQSLQAIVSPKIRFSLAYEMYSRAAKDQNSFELVSKADPFTTNALLLEVRPGGQQVTLLDTMIGDPNFNQHNIKTYKDNGGMTTEEHGRCNLEILYKNQDPQFVLNFLRSHRVPVILIAMSPVFIEEGKIVEFCIVSPYEKSFYANPDMQFIGHEKEIEELGKKRLDSAQRAFCNKRIKQNPVNTYFDGYDFESPLMNATLFGNDEDVSKELQNGPEHSDVVRSIIASIGSPNKKNNALECLLLKLNLLRQQGVFSQSEVLDRSYLLLSLAAHNKEAFELISHVDPYKMNMYPWATSSVGPYHTNLDRMINDKNFDEENIRVFIDNGGITTKEVHLMGIVGKILNNLPSRNIQMTFDEEPSIGPFREFDVVREFDVD